MIEVWVDTSVTWKNQSKTESVGTWREMAKELNPSWDVSQKKNLATHMVNTRRRPACGCSRCAEAGMQMGEWTTVFWKTHLGRADVVFLACETHLHLSVCPAHHQLLRQGQLAIETLDGLFCFLFRKGINVSRRLKCLTSFDGWISYCLVNRWQRNYKGEKKRQNNKKGLRLCQLKSNKNLNPASATYWQYI